MCLYQDQKSSHPLERCYGWQAKHIVRLQVEEALVVWQCIIISSNIVCLAIAVDFSKCFDAIQNGTHGPSEES